MKQMKLTTNNGITVYYDIDKIACITHGTFLFEGLLSRTAGFVVHFKNGQTSTFDSNSWLISFE